MTIKKYFDEYKWILVFAILVAVAAGLLAWRGDRYSASLALTVSRAGTQNAADYKYDNYYALRAGDEFGNVVEGWFKTPEMAQTIYKIANLEMTGSSLTSLSRRFQAAKISAGTVEVRFGGASAEMVQAIGRAVTAAASAKAAELSAVSGQGLSFSVTGSDMVIMENASAIWRNSLVGLLMGLVFGFFVKSGKEYFKD